MLWPKMHGPPELHLSGQLNNVVKLHRRTTDFQLPSLAHRPLRTKSLEPENKKGPRGQRSVCQHSTLSTEQQVDNHLLLPRQKELPPIHCNLGKRRDADITRDTNITKKYHCDIGEGHDKSTRTSGLGLGSNTFPLRRFLSLLFFMT